MEFKFNSLNRIEPPKIALCRVDTEIIGFLKPTNIVIKPTFCSVTELTFTVYEGTNLYDAVRKYMVLEVDGFGRFEITDPSEHNDGNTKYKEVTAQSYEVSLNASTITFKDDVTYTLWDPINPEKTLLGIISSQTGWTIAHVDADVVLRRRTLSIDNEQVYGFLMGDLSDAFKCYFVFDTMNKTISCYDREKAPANSGINLSFRNLIEEIGISQSSEDITTALTVVGAEGVGINLVNPLGNNVIYDFGYFMTDEAWGMPADLRGAVTAWLQKIESKQEDYKSLVLQQRELSEILTTLDGELSVLKAEHKSLLDAQSVAIAGNNNDRLKVLYPEVQEKENEVSAKEAEIKNKEELRQACISSKEEIVSSLSFENNFTEEQYKVLKYYIKGMVYENENFIFTSNMTEADKIDMADQLYAQGLKMMKKLSVPLCEFDVKVPGFLFNKGYELFAKALELGKSVNLELEPNVWVEPKLLQVTIDYDSPESTTITLSDNYRLMGDVYEFSRGFNETVKATRKTSLTAPLWDEPLKNGFYSTVTDYINNALNLVNQEIINASNQEFTIGSYGLRGKSYDEETDTYDPHQVAMTNNVIAFTDDNWESTKAALGKITIGTTDYYGLVAEAVVGKLVAGDQLTISNKNNSFVVDANGATLTNADFTVVSGKSRIKISPIDGFKIQKLKDNRTGEEDADWEDVLSEDTSGVITAKSIKLEDSDIGGWITTKDGLSSPGGDYINSNGTGKLSLLTWNGAQATFDGNIYANNLSWIFNKGSESERYAYIFSPDGSMGGSWLTDDSVGKNKLNKVWVDEIDGTIAAFNEIKANIITTDILLAGKIGTNDLYYGGKIYAGTVDNNVSLYSALRNIDAQHPNQQSFICDVNGNFIIETTTGQLQVTGKNGHKGSIYTDGSITSTGKISCNDVIETPKFTCSEDFELRCSADSSGNPHIRIKGATRFYDSIQTDYYGTAYYGASGSFKDKDGKKIVVANGLIVGIDANFDL